MLQSVTRYLIAFGLAYLVGHGVITQKIADANVAALTNYTLIVLGIAGTILWSFLEKGYKGVLDKYFPPGKDTLPPAARSLVLVLAPLAVVAFLVGCSGSTSPTPVPAPAPAPVAIAMPSSTVTGGITLITAAGVTAGLDFGVTQASTRTTDAGYLYTGASLVNQLAQGQPVTPAYLGTYLTTYGVQNNAQYAAIASTIVSLYDTYVYPKVEAGGNSAAVDAYLMAFAQGIQNGAAVYAPSTVLPATN